MKRFVFKVVLLLCLTMCVGSVYGATHDIYVDPVGFTPPNTTIEDGDTIRFHNNTGYPSLTIYHDSGPCWPWIISVPNNGTADITLPCGVGTEVYLDSVYSFSGTIDITLPVTPTPIPPTDVPSTSTAGIALALFVITLLLGVSTIKK